nr:putative formyltransferase [Vibrio mimicus]
MEISIENKLVFVVGGGRWQAPIINEIKAKGYEVLCSNLYDNTDGVSVSDYFECADIKNKQANLDIAKKYNPIAVLTDQTDIAVPVVAYIAETMNLNGIGVEVAERFTDKLKMRKAAESLGLNPRYREINSLKELHEAANYIGFPLILKPRCNQSSRGIVLVNNLESLEKSYNDCLLKSEELSVLAEEYIIGEEYTVEGFCFENKHYSLTTSVKEHYSSNMNVASKLVYPSGIDSRLKNSLFEVHNKLVSSLGLSFGITHAEYKYRDGKFYLIEVAARGGGTRISSDIIPTVTDCNVMDMLIDCSLGRYDSKKIIDTLSKATERKHVMLCFLDFKEGLVKNRTSESDLLSIEGVIDFQYMFNLGQSISRIQDDSSRHAFMLIKSESKAGLENLERIVRGRIELYYE